MGNNDHPKFRERKTDLRFAVWEISPEIARWLLDHSAVHNRVLNPDEIEKLRFAMATPKKWALNGMPVILDEGLNVLEGHHRLYVAAKYGLTFVSVVIIGIDEATVPTMNVGKKWTLFDNLTVLRPNLDSSHAKLAARALGLILSYAFGYNVPPFARIAEERLAYTFADPRFLDVVRRAAGEKRGLISTAQATALRYLGGIADPTISEEYVSGLLKGEDLKEGMPVYAVRQLLFEAAQKDNRLRMTPCVRFQLCHSGLAWRLQNLTISRLRKWKVALIPGVEPQLVREDWKAAA